MSDFSDMAKAFSPAYMLSSAMKKDKPPPIPMPMAEPMGSFLEDGMPKRRKPTGAAGTGSFLDGAKYS